MQMHISHPHTCNAPVAHRLHGEDWNTTCPNPVGPRCYKCERFFCDQHIRRHECDGMDEHPASD